MADSQAGSINETSTHHNAGEFCWWDIGTTDQKGASDFYSNIFDWSSVDYPVDESNTYTMFQREGKDVSAVMQMSNEEIQHGVPPHWNCYIAVEDVDASTDKATSLGAEVLMAPMDVMDQGRMSVIKDPTGAAVALWQPKNHGGAGLYNRMHSVVWNELATRDPKRAAEFYAGLLGWEAQENTMPGMDYTIFAKNGVQVGGMMQMDDSMQGVPPNWMPYVSVPDITATVAKTKELGGDVIVPPTTVTNVGTFSVLRDPQGGVFSAMEMYPQANG